MFYIFKITVYYFNIFLIITYSSNGKAEFSEAIISVFSVIWSCYMKAKKLYYYYYHCQKQL